MFVLLAEEGEGVMGSDRDEPDAHDMDDRAELTDQREAWPEDPELVEETEIRGRWLRYDMDGEMKAEGSDFTTPGAPAGAIRETCWSWPAGACCGGMPLTLTAAQARVTSSAKDDGSVLMMAMEGGAPVPGEPAVVELETGIGEVAADEVERDATGELRTAEETEGGGGGARTEAWGDCRC
jgi:hypothetical protein